MHKSVACAKDSKVRNEGQKHMTDFGVVRRPVDLPFFRHKVLRERAERGRVMVSTQATLITRSFKLNLDS